MTETENGDTTPLKPKKREGSRLDRGFPMGKILLIILGLVFFFQIISAWKIINLEREKAIYETDKQNFETQVKQRPGLEREISEFQNERKELQSEINDLKREGTQVAEELKKNQKLSTELKLANDAAEINLRETDIRTSKREEERALAFEKFVELNGKSNNLKQEIENDGKEKDILEEDLGKLNVKKQNLKDENNRLISDNVAIDARLKATEDELEKLRGAKTDLAGIISNLKVTSESFNSTTNTINASQSEANAKLNKAVDNLNHTTSNISSSAQEFKRSQSVANTKFIEAVDNINNETSKLEKTTTDYSTKIDQATNNLNENVVQLSTMRSELAKLSSAQLNNFAQRIDGELKIVDQRLNDFVLKQKQLEELLTKITRTSESLSSDRLGLQKMLSAVRLDVGNAVSKLDVATSNIETNSKDFTNKVSSLDSSNTQLNALLESINNIYTGIDSFKKRQTDLVDNFQELVKRIGTTSANLDDLLEFRKTFEKTEKDSSNEIEDVKDPKNNINEVEKESEGPNIDTKKLNMKEEE